MIKEGAAPEAVPFLCLVPAYFRIMKRMRNKLAIKLLFLHLDRHGGYIFDRIGGN